MSNPNNTYIISVMSHDRVGIVADVARVISQLDGNIEDLSQTILRGYFTMLLVAVFEEAVDLDAVRSALATYDLQVSVLSAETTPIPAITQPHDTYVLTATGNDRVGFVADVSAFCARHKISILDLSTQIDAGEYIMILLVDLAAADPLVTVRYQLRQFATQHDLNITLQHHDIFRVTNEIS